MIKDSIFLLLSSCKRSLSPLFSSISLLVTDGVISFVTHAIQFRERSKDIIGSNLELASIHYHNGNMFDAKLRYWIVTKLDKKNFDGYLGIAYVYYTQNRYKNAIEYFLKAKEFAGQRTAEVEEIINELSKKI